MKDVTINKLDQIVKARKYRDNKFPAYAEVRTNFERLNEYVRRNMELI